MSYLHDSEYVNARRAAEDALGMCETQGWHSLAVWIDAQVRMETEAVVNGSSSWEQYQLSVGRLDAYRRVLARPNELVAAAETGTGDSQ